MARLLLEEIKQRKNFYRDLYYRSLGVLLWLLVLIIIFMLIDAFVVLNQPQPDYYSTNTAGFIDRLAPMDHANETGNFLLKDETEEARMPGDKNMQLDET